MGDRSINSPLDRGPKVSRWVWFSGTTALLQGQGVCYNSDYGTASTAEERRLDEVELPSQSNSRWFAGVAARAYAARSGGQMIEIYCPGSICNVYTNANCVLDTGRITCEVGTAGSGQGYFTYAGFQGAGSAIPKQTVDRSSTAGTVLAYLEEGPPSGLVEVVLPVDNSAITCMVGGVTYFVTAVALTNGDSTFTLADGTLPGLRKAFVCQAAMTTNQVVITVTSGKLGIADADPTGALSTISLNADLEEVTLQWDAFDTNGLWVIQHHVGADLA